MLLRTKRTEIDTRYGLYVALGQEKVLEAFVSLREPHLNSLDWRGRLVWPRWKVRLWTEQEAATEGQPERELEAA